MLEGLRKELAQELCVSVLHLPRSLLSVLRELGHSQAMTQQDINDESAGDVEQGFLPLAARVTRGPRF